MLRVSDDGPLSAVRCWGLERLDNLQDGTNIAKEGISRFVLPVISVTYVGKK
jgi:hypothetical protein